jgi:hypothetical protein
MSTRPVICVGFVLAALDTLAFRQDEWVVFVEEPDVVRKRRSPVIRCCAR